MPAIGPIFSIIFGGIGSFLKAALTFLTTKPGVYILMAGIAVGAYWWSGHQGYARGVADTVTAQKLIQARAVALAEEMATAQQAEIDKALAADAYKFGLAEGKVQAKTITLTKEVPVYVTQTTDNRYPVPCGLYRVMRAAADGADADPSTVDLPPGLADGDACPITASDIASLSVQWAGLYHKATAQIAGLQELVRALAKEAAQ